MAMLRLLGATLVCAVLMGQTAPSTKTGPEVGSRIPDFSAIDQNGSEQNQRSILGPKGAILVFFRSADW